MKKLIGLILLILSIILIYYYSKSYSNSDNDNVENFYYSQLNNRDQFGLPPKEYIKENTAYISVRSWWYLDIYVDRGGKSKKLEVDINNKRLIRVNTPYSVVFIDTPFDPYNNDKLMFYQMSPSSVGTNWSGWCGHIFLNNVFYPTNRDNFRIVGIENRAVTRNKKSITSGKYGFTKGFKRIGCYFDNNNYQSPLLPTKHYSNNNKFDFEHCRELAYREGNDYFAIQNGGYCTSGKNKTRALSRGKAPEVYCGKKSTVFRKKPSLTKIKTSGAYNINDIHTVSFDEPKIRYVGAYWGRWPSRYRHHGIINTKKNPKVRISKYARFVKDTCLIQPMIGGSQSEEIHNHRWGNHIKDRWIQYEFIYKIPDSISFCPDKSYIEHNPSGCDNPINNQTCENSVVNGFTANNKECINLITKEYYNKNEYNNLEFTRVCADFFDILLNFEKKIEKKSKEDCKGKNKKNIIGSVFKTLRYKTNPSNINQADYECCKLCINNPKCEYWTRDNAGNVYLGKDFKKFNSDKNFRSALKSQSSKSTIYTKQLINSSKKPIQECIKTACNIIKNVDNLFDMARCDIIFKNYIKSGNASKTSEYFIKIIQRAMYISSNKNDINGKNPNQNLRKILEEQLVEFLNMAKAIIVKAGAFFVSCSCTKSIAKCTPC